MKCDICSEKSEDFLFVVEESDTFSTPTNFEYCCVLCEDCVEEFGGIHMIDYYVS